MNSQKAKFSFPKKSFTRFIALIYIQAIASAIWILAIPGEAENAIFLGYSFRRLALLLPIVFLILLAGIVQFYLKKKVFQDLFMDEKKRRWIARTLVIVGASLAMLMLAVFCFYHYLLDFPDIGAFYRLMPVLIFLFLTGVELMLFVPLALYKQATKKKKSQKIWLSPAFWAAFLILLVLFAVIEITGMGKSPVRVSIITLGVPLLEGQVWFVIGMITIYMVGMNSWSSIEQGEKNGSWKYKDIFIFLLIWVIAFVFWMQFPLPEHNYFAPSVRPPTFEKYPFSDAEQYDYNSLYVLFGALDDFVISKPLYVSFLAILHWIGGIDYERIVLLQTIIVALLPGVVYLIGKELHSRIAGVGIAIFIILREANSIISTSMANVSNSKLLMSDQPATLVVAIIVFVIIRWCRHKKEKVSHHVFLLGGLTAMLNLMRIQTLALIPFFIVLIIIRYFKSWKKILLAVGIYLLTVALLLAPIIIRNHSITGVYWVDNPSSSTAVYKFILTGSDVEFDVSGVETSEDIINRNISALIVAVTQNLLQLIVFILDNFFRNLISTILILPVRLGNQVPFEDFFRMNSPFFAEVYSEPGFLNFMVLAINIAIISLGFSQVHKSKKQASIFVVLFYLAYNASSSVVRLSGWRFIQPVDWIMLIFFTIGIFEFVQNFSKHIVGHEITINTKQQSGDGGDKNKTSLLILSGFTFVLFCAFIPLREALLPKYYPEYDIPLICSEIEEIVNENEYNISPDEIYEFCMADDTRVYKGYGLYPRWFDFGDGYYTRTYDQYFGRQDYARLVFRVVGGRKGKVYIKTDDPKIEITNGQLVYALLQDRPKADAQLVIVHGEEPQVIFSDPIKEGIEDFKK